MLFPCSHRPDQLEKAFLGTLDLVKTVNPAEHFSEMGRHVRGEGPCSCTIPGSPGLERADPSYLLLATLAGIIVLAGILYRVGLIGWVLRCVGLAVRGCIRTGFLYWERLLAWASWPLFLAIVFGFLIVGVLAGGPWPSLKVICGLAPLFMGIIACLAYMFIDLERNEVETGSQGRP